LEDAFNTASAWPHFEPILRDLVTSLGDKKLRDRFVAVCMEAAASHERRLFHQFEGSKFEWRFWGNLEDQTRQLSELWPLLVRWWDFGKMSADGALGSASLRLITRAVANECGDLPGIRAMLASASALSQAVGFNARWMRGCRCHSDLHLASPTYVKRRRLMKELQEGEDGICMWAGRNGIAMALGAVEDMCQVVEKADTDHLRVVLAASSEVVRVIALRFSIHAKSRWCEQVREKFRFWQELPHLICGLLGMYMGYTIQACCDLGRRVVLKLTSCDDRSRLHRVALDLLTSELLMVRCMLTRTGFYIR
jgi:hypothetical protein